MTCHGFPSTVGGAPEEPYWNNGFFCGLDPVSLYALAAIHNPTRYIEIGSGNSTKFVKQTVRDQALKTQVTSIDPCPRAEIDLLCDVVIREPLESIDLSLFETLSAGDFLFVDGSHRCFTNSDVTIVFLEILPKLKPGVLIYIDDIYLPSDYPASWSHRWYSEQYLLATLLLNEVALSLPPPFP